jgi:hypothetical protein
LILLFSLTLGFAQMIVKQLGNSCSFNYSPVLA